MKKKDIIHRISATITNKDDSKVRIEYSGETMPDVQEFTSMIMGLLDSYIAGLLVKNKREDVYDHFNRIFGICLTRILPPSEIYNRDSKHKEFKEVVDKTLGRKETAQDEHDTTDNRMAAYILAADILRNECGMTEDSINAIMSKRLNLIKPVSNEEINKASDKFKKALEKKNDSKANNTDNNSTKKDV